jgi:4-diphosphocytidyl-2-C-methyl-D-erythritol kinase
MLLFPNCKINLGLNIIRKRDDGFHDLETVFYPLPLNDALEAVSLGIDAGEPRIHFTSSGLEIKAQPEANLCVKAYHLLKKDFPDLPSVHLHLHKAIPIGAGLGGGSADGAFTLLLLNKLFQLNLTIEQLSGYAVQLGSDCPFFLHNKPCYATGRGELLQEIQLDLSAYKFVIVNPGIHISTAEAFSGMIPGTPQLPVMDTLRQPVTKWRGSLVNDFEISVAKRYPEIAAIKEQLYANGALYASMTGSGSTVYGLFEREKEINLSLDTQYFIRHL